MAGERGITPACAGKRPKGRAGLRGHGDHPRVRGEKTGPAGAAAASQAGITPARAGKRLDAHSDGGRLAEDHPRARGEKVAGGGSKLLGHLGITPACAGKRVGVTVVDGSEGGSPPRARGKGQRSGFSISVGRITPACAGKRRHAVGGPERAGSPPRARGKGTMLADGVGMRITPACAGKSPAPPKKGPGLWDHPRVRGEKRLHSWRAMSMSGSPPRARGKDWEEVWGEDGFGITPACAGKRSGKSGSAEFCRDHPRVRGEKRRPGLCPAVAQGITPACAGKSACTIRSEGQPRDHPRVRGEKVSLPHQSAGEQDHPRVRGEKSLSRKEPWPI